MSRQQTIDFFKRQLKIQSALSQLIKELRTADKNLIRAISIFHKLVNGLKKGSEEIISWLEQHEDSADYLWVINRISHYSLGYGDLIRYWPILQRNFNLKGINFELYPENSYDLNEVPVNRSIIPSNSHGSRDTFFSDLRIPVKETASPAKRKASSTHPYEGDEMKIIAELEAENDRLYTENAQLRAELAATKKENRQLKAGALLSGAEGPLSIN